MRVTSYNVLADAYASKRLYPNVPAECLDWTQRSSRVAARIEELNPDVVCLQEVEAVHWTGLRSSLAPLGWDGIFAQKKMARVDGCAILYRTGAVSLIQSEPIYFQDGEEPSGHLALVGLLATALGPVRIVSTHLRWQADTTEPAAHIGYRQAQELLGRCPGDAAATIICGDFNAPSRHPLLRLFSDNAFSDAYAAAPQPTCAPNGRASRIDYIWVSRTLKGVGERLPALQNSSVLPNADEPSDHLPITACVDSAEAAY